MPHRPEVEQLMHDLTRTFKAFAALRGAAPGLHPGIEQAAIPLLFRLECEPMRVGALAELIHSDISTVSRQVTGLVKAGLVTKSADPADGRAQVLALTDLGRDVTTRLRSQRCSLLAAILRDWSDDQVRSAGVAFADFADALEASLRDENLRSHLPHPVSF